MHMHRPSTKEETLPGVEMQTAEAAFEADLQAALAASSADAAAASAELRLDRTMPPLARSSGFCAQRNLLNQFHGIFRAAIDEHHTGSAICGYLTIAHVRLLRSLLTGVPSDRPLTAAECAAVGDALMASPECVLHEVRRAMASIRRRRAAYVDAHRADFDAAGEDRYYRAWVANYEISDELRESLDAERPVASLFAAGGARPHVHFARFNEWVSIGEATHEERARIAAEQRRFGGTVDARGVAHFGAGDSAVILERIGRSSSRLELLTPLEWTAAERADGLPTGAPRVFAVDTSGHFYAALACRVGGGAGGAGGAVEDVLLALNTTNGSYLGWPMASLLHGHIFGSQSASGALDGARDGDLAGAEGGAVAELRAMGFEASASRAALAQAGGSVPSAVELLLAAAAG